MDAAPCDSSMRAESANAERALDLQLQFNLFPARYAHPSWYGALGDLATLQEEYRQFSSSPAWIRAMSSALLRANQLHQHFDGDFFDPAKRLALMDAAALTRIAGLVSATLLRDRLKRTVQSSQVRALQASIGVEAHTVAVRWQGLLPMINGIVERDAWPTTQEWERHSVAQLLSVLPNHAIGVLGRVRMKFPADWALPRQRLAEPQRVALTRLIVAMILHTGSSWSWLFAPDFTRTLAAEGMSGAA